MFSQHTICRYGVELIGAKLHAIDKAEDRLLFRDACDKLGIKSAPSGIANNMEEAWDVAKQVGGMCLLVRRQSMFASVVLYMIVSTVAS